MTNIVWEKAAEKALANTPFFVRPLVRRKLEDRVRSQGGSVVTLHDFQQAEARFRAVSAGKSDAELQQLMPRENATGVEMLVIEVCHSALSNCPNVLISTEAWKTAIEEWAQQCGISERLRRRVAGETILHHHKFRISISGCPNGCSRPQIADIGLLGFVRPALDPRNCTACGACAAACPDSAITPGDGVAPDFSLSNCQGCRHCRDACAHECISLSPPGVRVLLGGKLGRHPHLAEFACELYQPAELVALLDQLMTEYIDNATPDERFADYLARRK